MSTTISIYLDDNTERRLEEFAKRMDRSVRDLAETAVAEYVLDMAKREGIK